MEEIISNYHRMVDGLKEYDYSVILEAIHEAGTIYISMVREMSRRPLGRSSNVFS